MAHHRDHYGHLNIPPDIRRLRGSVERGCDDDLLNQYRHVSNWLGSCANFSFVDDTRVNQLVVGKGRSDRDKVKQLYLNFSLYMHIFAL